MWWALAAAAWAGDGGDCRNARRFGTPDAWAVYVLERPSGKCVGEAYGRLVAAGLEPSAVGAVLVGLNAPDPGTQRAAAERLVELLRPGASPAPPPASWGVARPPRPPPEELASMPPDAQVSESGLGWRVLAGGTGTVTPGPTDRVRVHYAVCGASPPSPGDDPCFDDSWSRGEPSVFPLNAVVKGFSEGLQGMVVGEVRRLWVPPALGYGEEPRPGIPAGLLVFDVALLSIEP